jgi:hypothetical protein
MAEARQRVEEADVAQRRAEEQQLVQLAALEQQRQAQERQALLQAASDTAGVIGEAKEMGFLQEQALDIRTQQQEAAEKRREAQAKAEAERRLASQGGRTNEQIRSSPTTQFGSQPAAAPVAEQPMSTAVTTPAALDRFDILALQEAGALSQGATGVPPEIIQRALELNMPLEDYLLLRRSMGSGI